MTRGAIYLGDGRDITYPSVANGTSRKDILQLLEIFKRDFERRYR